MTKIEEQALVVAKAWRHYTAIDQRLAKDRENSQADNPRRLSGEREQDARDVRPACSAYKKELDILTQMVL